MRFLSDFVNVFVVPLLAQNTGDATVAISWRQDISRDPSWCHSGRRRRISRWHFRARESPTVKSITTGVYKRRYGECPSACFYYHFCAAECEYSTTFNCLLIWVTNNTLKRLKFSQTCYRVRNFVRVICPVFRVISSKEGQLKVTAAGVSQRLATKQPSS